MGSTRRRKFTGKKRTNKKVKINRRESRKYPGLDPNVNLKIRWEELDQDYIHKLSEKDKAWLNSFNEETIGAKFNHKGKKLYKSKKAKRELYSKNNARNRCMYSKAKAQDALVNLNDDKMRMALEGLDSEDNTYRDKEYLEDALIDYIDEKRKKN